MMLSPEHWTAPQHVLVLLAHPDDPEFFCGGTLARWAAAGHHVAYCLLCCGDKGWNPMTPEMATPDGLCAIRRAEQENAARIIGARSVEFLDFRDGELVADLSLRREIVRVIRLKRPDVLVTCDPQNLFAAYGLNHPDHRAAGQAVLDAVFPAAGNKFYYPDLLAEGLVPHTPREVWVSLTNQPDTTLDITEFWPTRLRAILQHRSQVQDEQKLIERLQSRRTPDSTPENPRYEEKFRVIRYG